MTNSGIFQKFYYEILVRESHLDTFGHMNNATYLQLFEEARWEMITQNGYGLEKIKDSKLGPIILEINIQYRREIHLREKIRIETEALSYDKKVGRLRQAMVNESGQICCEATMSMGLFDTVQRKLVAPTPEWLRAIGTLGAISADAGN